jgi:DNA-binding NarL/FixJ family response regulator
MSLEYGVIFLSIAVGAASIVLSLACRAKLNTLRGLFDFAERQIADLQDTVAKNKEMFDMSTQRINEQSRRIAWLETRVRQPKLSRDEVVDDSGTIEPVKASMTERRHRIINLASRGQNAESIASKLGMLTGEVELILNLNRAAVGVK